MTKACGGTKEGFVCLNMKELKYRVLREAHKSTYSIHLGRNKMYHDLKATNLWYGMKRDAAGYVALHDTC
jgi:hypothetical protein